jgi:hypothetical protein
MVYPQIYSTDLNDLICKIDLNSTMTHIKRSWHQGQERSKSSKT